jgi:hypothetical protein
VYYGFFRRKAISTSELDPNSELLIADMIDRNHIKGDKPFARAFPFDPGSHCHSIHVTAIVLRMTRSSDFDAPT